MNVNEIVGRLKAGGLDASSTNRSAAVYVTEERAGRAEPGWFGFRIICDSDETERRVRAILSRWYDIEANGNVWRLKSKNRVPLMAIKRGGVPPTPPTPTDGPMYFEAVQANSTVSLMSTLTTAPNLEYSTDGENWQEWQHTTADGTHTFDTLTLTAVGDRIYIRGDNQNLGGFTGSYLLQTIFCMNGKLYSGGNVLSILDEDMLITDVPDYCFTSLFDSGLAKMIGLGSDQSLLTTPDLSKITSIGDYGCGQEGAGMFNGNKALTRTSDLDDLVSVGIDGCLGMYSGCVSLKNAAKMPKLETVNTKGLALMYSRVPTRASSSSSACVTLDEIADMPSLTSVADSGCIGMFKGTAIERASDMPLLANIGDDAFASTYEGCTFDMSSDGSTLNFDFPTPPITTAGDNPQTYATAYDVADWMGNTNGFTEP